MGWRFWVWLPFLINASLFASPQSCDQWLEVLGLQEYLSLHSSKGAKLPKPMRRALRAEIRERMRQLASQPVEEPSANPVLDKTTSLTGEPEEKFPGDKLFFALGEKLVTEYTYENAENIVEGVKHRIFAEQVFRLQGEQVHQLNLGGVHDANEQILALTLWNADLTQFQGEYDFMTLRLLTSVLSRPNREVLAELQKVDFSRDETISTKDQVVMWDIADRVNRFHLDTDAKTLQEDWIRSMPLLVNENATFGQFLFRYLSQKAPLYHIYDSRTLEFFLKNTDN